MQPGVGVIVARDNCEMLIGDKRQLLVESSDADYCSMIDDDDTVSDHYVASIMNALSERPDVVGMRVQYLFDGVPEVPMIYTMHHRQEVIPGYPTDAQIRACDHLNATRRDIVMMAGFSGGANEDVRFQSRIENLGVLKSEVLVNDTMYWYNQSQYDGFHTHRAIDDIPDMPVFEFVRYI